MHATHTHNDTYARRAYMHTATVGMHYALPMQPHALPDDARRACHPRDMHMREPNPHVIRSM